MQLELAELDQVFTAKSIDRGVLDTCSTGSTGRISSIGITGASTGTGTGTGTGSGTGTSTGTGNVTANNSSCSLLI